MRMKTSKMHREKEANVAKDASEQSFWVWCCCVWESCSESREQMSLVLFLSLLSIWAIQWKMGKERKKKTE